MLRTSGNNTTGQKSKPRKSYAIVMLSWALPLVPAQVHILNSLTCCHLYYLSPGLLSGLPNQFSYLSSCPPNVIFISQSESSSKINWITSLHKWLPFALWRFYIFHFLPVSLFASFPLSFYLSSHSWTLQSNFSTHQAISVLKVWPLAVAKPAHGLFLC